MPATTLRSGERITVTTVRGALLDAIVLSVGRTTVRLFVGGSAPFRTFRHNEIAEVAR